MKNINRTHYYVNGWYSMPAPPVATVQWEASDWIYFIDSTGKWVKPGNEARYKQALNAYREGIYSAVDAAAQYQVDPCVLSHGIEFFNVEVSK